jgi:hypothetical protein
MNEEAVQRVDYTQVVHHTTQHLELTKRDAHQRADITPFLNTSGHLASPPVHAESMNYNRTPQW